MRIRDRTKELPNKGKYPSRLLSSVDTIVIHHSATPPVTDNAMAFARYHVGELGWAGIGYHYVVNPDGTIDKCHPTTVVSNQAHGANRHGIGICLAGSFDDQAPPKAQWQAALELCRDLIIELPSIHKIIGHREIPGTHKSCPGFCFDMALFRSSVRIK